mmetsp:Transcript_4838/g.13989  ORF Transcript_4838/g.13989 Transcript_4838/m.13989 type:complete len:212 (-) Transcript_4838:50-685(-)
MNSRTPCVVQCSAVQCKTPIPDRTAPHHNISHRARVGGLVWFPFPPHTTERDEEPTTESYVQACWTTPIHNNARSNPTVPPRPRLFGSQSKVAIGGPAEDIMIMYTVLPYIRSLLLNGMHACMHPSIHDGTPTKGYIVTVLVDCMAWFRFVSFRFVAGLCISSPCDATRCHSTQSTVMPLVTITRVARIGPEQVDVLRVRFCCAAAYPVSE